MLTMIISNLQITNLCYKIFSVNLMGKYYFVFIKKLWKFLFLARDPAQQNKISY